MSALDALIAQAQADTDGLGGPRAARATPLNADEAEVARQLQICNACRYCEGFCAVFPAMTRRLEFGRADVHYLSNLCHNCSACLYACQYAPPHEFAVNVPRAMARVRLQTYQDYAWPAPLGALYRRAGTTVALALAGGISAFLWLALAMTGSLVNEPLAGNFYAVFPHNVLAALFGAVFVLALSALALGVRRFWTDVSPAHDGQSGSPDAPVAAPVLRAAGLEAGGDVLTLRYLGGGHGEGCNEEDDRTTLWRRRWHQTTLYGFALCLASTAVATLYHYLGDLHAPYTLTSVPVLLGTVGGLGLLAGPLGLLWLNLHRAVLQGDPAQRPMDRGFIALLLLTSATGLALLALRDSRAMAGLLALHLGVVLALFVTLPYGKFAHGAFRGAALLKFAIEKRLPSRLQLGED